MTRLLSSEEVAARLGVSPRRVRALAQLRDDFPAPVVRRPSVLLWDAAAIEQWARTADRSVGRPKAR